MRSPEAFAQDLYDAFAKNGQFPSTLLKANGKTAADSLILAGERGRIFRGEAGLRNLAKELEAQLGIEVDFSKVQRGGMFDNGPTIPLP